MKKFHYLLIILLIFLFSSCKKETKAIPHKNSKPKIQQKKKTQKTPLTPRKQVIVKKKNPTPKVPKNDALIWNFEKVALNKLPSSFLVHEGTWKIIKDGTAKKTTKVLAQLKANKGWKFNVILVKSTNVKDLDLSVKMKALKGKIDQGGGLIWRAKDGKNYYVVRYNPLEDNFRLYYVKNGRRRLLKNANIKIDHKAWHTLRVLMKDTKIKVFLDGQQYLEMEHKLFTQAGHIGLWTKADARTYFKDLTLKQLKK